MTKREMFDDAREQSLDEGINLEATFENWQKRGLLAGMVGRNEHNEGLWHFGQSYLWLAMLRHRQKGSSLATLSTLANMPIGMWLYAAPGIELAQAQRAFGVWADISPKRPTGDRSLRHQIIKEMAEQVADPSAPPGSVHALRRELTDLADGGVRESRPVQQEFRRAALSAIAPAGEPTKEQRDSANILYEQIFMQSAAMPYAAFLCRNTQDARDFWEWGRRVAWGVTKEDWDEFAKDFWTKHSVPLEGEALFGWGLNISGRMLLWIFGMGITYLIDESYPLAVEVPPQIELPK